MINAAPALAGFGPGRCIGRGRKAICPAVTYSSVHTFPAFPAPILLSLIAQIHSPEKLCTALHDSTTGPSQCSKRTSASWNDSAVDPERSVAHYSGDIVRTTRYSALPLIILS